MRASNACLLVIASLVADACGARTGDDLYGAYAQGDTGGTSLPAGGNTFVTSNASGGQRYSSLTGGIPSYGGSWRTPTGGYNYGGQVTACSLGSYGCSCLSDYTCYYPYTCSFGKCTYASSSTGGTSFGGTTWGYTSSSTAISCAVGTWGCKCYSSGACAAPYTCVSGYCIGYATTGGAPSYGGSTPVGYGGSAGAGGYSGYGGSRTITIGGHVSIGGTSNATAGTSPLDVCRQNLSNCISDSGCASMLTCVLNYSTDCNTDVSCYLIKCMSQISGTSATLAIDLFQSCATALNL